MQSGKARPSNHVYFADPGVGRNRKRLEIMRTHIKGTHSFILITLCCLLLAACGPSRREIPDIPPDELYRRASISLKSGSYESAIRQLRTIRARFPFSEYADQAMLDLLYAYAQLGDAESVDEEGDQFIQENPRHANIDYIYYIRGLAYFGKEDRNFIQRWFKADVAKRDISDARRSFQHFRQLLERYPKSQYAADARQRMITLRNRMARHEIYVANYYMKREAYVSAVNRAKYVIENLPDTPSTADALRIMARAYRQLDLNDLAEDAERILLENGAELPREEKIKRKTRKAREQNS